MRGGEMSPNPLQLQEYESGEEYVKRNHDRIANILKHGSDPLTRSYAYAILLHYGGEHDINQVKRELDTLAEQEGITT